MLDAAFASWTSSLTERGFDEAFLSLLRANGFHDVHFTHGPYEFGKDVVAKLTVGDVVEQHAFQSKAGDISGGVWDQIYSQMNELLGSTFTHPNFDASAPQVRHLVTTGRLVGKAILSAKEFATTTAAARNVRFLVDDRDRLLELLSGLPPTNLIASRSTALETVIGRIAAGPVAEVELEPLLGRFVTNTMTQCSAWRALLDISVAARALAASGRPLHASWALLHGIRLGAVLSHYDQALAKEVLRAGMRLYIDSGRVVLASFLSEPTSPPAWAAAVGNGFGVILGYPVAVAHVMEYLGLTAFFQENLGEHSSASKTAELLASVVDSQPGAARPISDRYAASITIAAAALARFGHRSSGESLLIRTLNWVCDRYQDSVAGLGGPYSDPETESRLLLLSHLDIELPRRRESLIAVSLADVAHAFFPHRYEGVINDLLAVRIVPSALHANDHPDAYFVDRPGQTAPLMNIRYPETRQLPVPHFALQVAKRTPEQLGGPGVPLALAAVLRDRLFTDVFGRLVATDLP